MSCNPLIRLYRGYLRVTRFLPPVPRNLFTTLLFLCAAYLVSDTLIGHTGAENNSALVFVLSVMFISLLTNGYFYGLIASLVGAFCINYFFMFPYRAFSLSYSGYPVAMVSMTLISGVVCALTSRVKLQAVEAMKREQDTKALYELNAKLNEEKAAIQLEAARETIRGNILRAVSHDLRTPLTAISGAASVLLSSEEIAQSEKNLSLVQDIKSDADALIAMVENLLSITRIENGTMQLQIEAELLDEVFQEALAHVDRQSKQHDISVNLSDDLLMAKMDVRLIVQVIINIVNNAIKYTPVGSHIRLSAEKQDDMVRISISDDGQGISGEAKKHLFDMFYTAGIGKPDNRRGLGLGLGLCKSIIDAHGGTIGVEDNIPQGSVFYFTLPLEEVSLQYE